MTEPHPQRCEHGSKTKDGKTICFDTKGCDYQRWGPNCRTLLFCSASHSQQEPEQKFIDNAITFACEKHDAAIRKEERERVLELFGAGIDKFMTIAEELIYDDEPIVTVQKLVEIMESLRAGDE
jgi:hypothetical protein